MTILESIKRAFGFSGEDYIEEDPNDDDVDNSLISSQDINISNKEDVETTNSDEEKKTEVVNNTAVVSDDSDTLPEGALQGLIKILNSNLPDYVRDCIDEDAQRKYICNAMGSSLKDFTESIKKKAIEDEHVTSQSSLVEANAQIKELNASLDEMKSKSSELNAKYILTESQRKASILRIQELEGKVAQCEAEMEQYDLETKSLQNKLKVMQVQGGDGDYMQSENERLLNELNRVKAELLKRDEEAETIKEGSPEMIRLKAELEIAKNKIEEYSQLKSSVESGNSQNQEFAAMKAELDETKRQLENKEAIHNEELISNIAELDELQNQLKEAKNQLEEKNKAVEEITEKYTIGASFVESLRKSLNEANQELNELKNSNSQSTDVVPAADSAEVEELKDKLQFANEQLAFMQNLRNDLNVANRELDKLRRNSGGNPKMAADNSEMEAMKSKLRLANEQIASLNEELTEANANLEIVEKIQDQLDGVEAMKKKKDDKIDYLNASIISRDKEIESLENDVDVLKKSIEAKQLEYSAHIKRISSMYEKKLGEKNEQNTKKRSKENFDMTMLDDILAQHEEKTIKQPEKKEEVTLKNHVDEVPVYDADDENVDKVSIPDTVNNETLLFDMEEDSPSDVNDVKKHNISAIDTHNDDWLRPSPPSMVSPSVEIEGGVKISLKKEEKEIKNDDTTQMSLF